MKFNYSKLLGRMREYGYTQETWLKAAGVRAIKTVAQTAVAMIPVGVTVTEVGWLAVLGTALLAGITSLLTSVAGLSEVKVEDNCDENG